MTTDLLLKQDGFRLRSLLVSIVSGPSGATDRTDRVSSTENRIGMIGIVDDDEARSGLINV